MGPDVLWAGSWLVVLEVGLFGCVPCLACVVGLSGGLSCFACVTGEFESRYIVPGQLRLQQLAPYYAHFGKS